MTDMFDDDNNLRTLKLGTTTNLNRHDQDWKINSDSSQEIPFFQHNVDANGNDSTASIKDGAQGGWYLYVYN